MIQVKFTLSICPCTAVSVKVSHLSGDVSTDVSAVAVEPGEEIVYAEKGEHGEAEPND